MPQRGTSIALRLIPGRHGFQLFLKTQNRDAPQPFINPPKAPVSGAAGNMQERR